MSNPQIPAEGRLGVSFLDNGEGMQLYIVTENPDENKRQALMAVLSVTETESLINHIQTRAPWLTKKNLKQQKS